MNNFWETEPPTFINEKEFKWWLDKETTKYAQKENIQGIKLNIIAYIVMDSKGTLDRVLVKDNQVIYSSQSLEAIGAYIDWLKLDQVFE